MAAKLYGENADLVARIAAATKKLQAAQGDGAAGEPAPAATLEALVDRLLAQLAEERQARAQAEAAFDLATADAMKHEAEKEEALIDRDFLR